MTIGSTKYYSLYCVVLFTATPGRDWRIPALLRFYQEHVLALKIRKRKQSFHQMRVSTRGLQMLDNWDDQDIANSSWPRFLAYFPVSTSGDHDELAYVHTVAAR